MGRKSSNALKAIRDKAADDAVTGVIACDLRQSEFDRMWREGMQSSENAVIAFPNTNDIARLIENLKNATDEELAASDSPINLSLHWTPEMDSILGTDTDSVVANRLGKTIQAVAYRRSKLGKIKRKQRGSWAWTPEMDAMFTASTDKEISESLGKSIASVRSRRLRIGSKKREARKNHVWTPEMDALLGTKSDPVIAKLLGIPSATISSRRSELGIDSHVTHMAWTLREDEILMSQCDSYVNLAKQFGRSLSSVYSRVKILKASTSRQQ